MYVRTRKIPRASVTNPGSEHTEKGAKKGDAQLKQMSHLYTCWHNLKSIIYMYSQSRLGTSTELSVETCLLIEREAFLWMKRTGSYEFVISQFSFLISYLKERKRVRFNRLSYISKSSHSSIIFFIINNTFKNK